MNMNAMNTTQKINTTKSSVLMMVSILIIIMASSTSGQYAASSVLWLDTRAGKMEWYCPPRTSRFVPANKISPKFNWVHERFFVISVFMEPENGKNRKRQPEWKQRKQKCLWVLKNTFSNRNRQTQKVKSQSDMKAWKRFCFTTTRK